jgi:hypothetical protein
MLGLIILNLRIVVTPDLRLPQGAPHQALELVNVLQTILQVIEIVDILEKFLGI